MSARPQWKGYLKLSLVSCAVALYPATSTSARTRFHTLNKATGHRVRRQFIDAETGEVVDNDEQVRGFEVAKDTYVLVEDEELDAVALESTHTIDIDRFVKRTEIDDRYLDRPYYLAPDDNVSQQAFAVIRDAMRFKKVVGLARVVLARREHIVMLEPWDAGMLATVLRYGYEVRQAEPVLEAIEATETPKEMLDLASHIVETKLGHFDVANLKDRYEEALVSLIRQKQSGKVISSPAPSRPSNVVNLMDALRQSLASTKPARDRSETREQGEPRKESHRKASSRRPRPKQRGGRGSKLRKAS